MGILTGYEVEIMERNFLLNRQTIDRRVFMGSIAACSYPMSPEGTMGYDCII